MPDAKSNEEAIERLRKARGFLFDLDGTLVLGNKANKNLDPLPGALELTNHLSEAGIPFVVFTNGTVRTTSAYIDMLRPAGFPIADGAMITPSSVAADYLARNKFKRVLVLGCEGVWRPLEEAGIDVILPDAAVGEVDAVYVGWYREFTMSDIEAACEAVWNGAALFTASSVPFFATTKGRAMGTSFVITAAITAVTGKEATVLGKPSTEALDYAARILGVEKSEIAVVGDDPELEMGMARDGGALAVAVTTGLNDQAAFLANLPEHRPDIIFANVAEVYACLRG